MKREFTPYREALRHLWNGKDMSLLKGKRERFICYAFAKMLRTYKNDYDKYYIIIEAKSHVVNCIAPYHDVGNWLIGNNHVKDQYYVFNNEETIQKFRRRWLIQLAKDYDKGLI